MPIVIWIFMYKYLHHLVSITYVYSDIAKTEFSYNILTTVVYFSRTFIL